MKRTLRIFAAFVAACAFAAPAFACPVCYGGASGSMIDGAKLSVLFLGSLVYLLIGAGVGVVLLLRRRVKKNLDPRHGLRSIPRPGEPDLTRT